MYILYRAVSKKYLFGTNFLFPFLLLNSHQPLYIFKTARQKNLHSQGNLSLGGGGEGSPTPGRFTLLLLYFLSFFFLVFFFLIIFFFVAKQPYPIKPYFLLNIKNERYTFLCVVCGSNLYWERVIYLLNSNPQYHLQCDAIRWEQFEN